MISLDVGTNICLKVFSWKRHWKGRSAWGVAAQWQRHCGEFGFGAGRRLELLMLKKCVCASTLNHLGVDPGVRGSPSLTCYAAWQQLS